MEESIPKSEIVEDQMEESEDNKDWRESEKFQAFIPKPSDQTEPKSLKDSEISQEEEEDAVADLPEPVKKEAKNLDYSILEVPKAEEDFDAMCFKPLEIVDERFLEKLY